MERRHRPWWTSRFFLVLAAISLIIGLVLMGLNLYGLTQPIRKPGLGVTDVDQLRFVPDEVWSYEKSMEAIARLDGASPNSDLAKQANRVVNQSLVHVSWKEVDPVEYRQLIPPWENYFLWGIGKFSGLPQFERYHYANYQRNIKRGIGICGDASTILSSIMDKHEIPNRIISFRGHVIVEYQREDGRAELIDPDFGVELEMTLDQLRADPEQAKAKYLAAGYSEKESETLRKAYQTSYAVYDNTFHFMSNRYLFEELSYWLKWLLPTLLILLSALYFRLWAKANKRDIYGI
ncbi:hypothetical protein SAMN04487962_12231 [Marinobacter segnicrescens]|uniref:Transglutaminase-like superfamily protein n=1 Tax=Marinobacter segnicrescens TaxID=430453 RepID=A0A1I0H048_9GAMM|nr:hypothetical protein [Marinobacter segnicrescens]SET76895.1 hypothetical protein SAMN04487962_12231 [Marinobacter segnicrescens]